MQQTNTTIRVHWPGEDRVMSPVNQPFSPLRLDESDSDFVQLENALCQGDEGLVSDRLRTREHDESMIPEIIRNVRLKGGIWMIVVLSIGARSALIDTLFNGQDIVPFLFWLALLAMFIFMKRGTGPYSKTQWFCIPGGLILRRASRNNAHQSNLHVFDRRNCVLGVIQTQKKTWFLCVKDQSYWSSPC